MIKDFTLVETDWIAYLEKLPVVKSISKLKNKIQLNRLPHPPAGQSPKPKHQFNIPSTFPPTLCNR
jgi:hypothetical protein